MAEDSEEPGRSPEEEEALMAEWEAMAGGGDSKEPEENTGDQDAMAAEWEAMLGDDGGDDDGPSVSSGGQSTRVLNQY